MPLCLGDDSLAGMVSNRDIVAQVVAKGRDPTQVSLAEFVGAADVVALDVDVTLEEAVAVMCRHQRDRLPVIEGDRVVGFVTRRRRRPLPQLPPALDRGLRVSPPERQRSPDARPMVSAQVAASSEVTTRRPNAAPSSSTTTAGPVPWTAAKSLPKSPRRVPTAMTLGIPVPGARMPRQLGPRVVDEPDRRHRGQRQADVPVEGLGLLERAHVEDQLVALDEQVRHGGRV